MIVFNKRLITDSSPIIQHSTTEAVRQTNNNGEINQLKNSKKKHLTKENQNYLKLLGFKLKP